MVLPALASSANALYQTTSFVGLLTTGHAFKTLTGQGLPGGFSNGSWSSLPAYISAASAHWCRLFWHCVTRARLFALARAGKSNAARTPMMPMTTSSSISVKACDGTRSRDDMGMELMVGSLSKTSQSRLVRKTLPRSRACVDPAIRSTSGPLV